MHALGELSVWEGLGIAATRRAEWDAKLPAESRGCLSFDFRVPVAEWRAQTDKEAKEEAEALKRQSPTLVSEASIDLQLQQAQCCSSQRSELDAPLTAHALDDKGVFSHVRHPAWSVKGKKRREGEVTRRHLSSDLEEQNGNE